MAKRKTSVAVPAKNFVEKTSVGLKANKKRTTREKAPLLIKLNISGGVHSQKFDFKFNLSEDGALSCGIDCELSDRKAQMKNGSLSKTEFNALMRDIERSKVLNAKGYMGQFIPCTLVGTLEINIDGKNFIAKFAADPAQARQHYKRIGETAELDMAVNAIYIMAAKKMKIKNVRP